jgi:exopolyphosphatase/pppGpp-phosphohydrolase
MTRAETEAHTAYAARQAEHRSGAVVLSSVAEVMGAELLTASEWGLREGIVLEAAGIADALKVDDRVVLAGSH